MCTARVVGTRLALEYYQTWLWYEVGNQSLHPQLLPHAVAVQTQTYIFFVVMQMYVCVEVEDLPHRQRIVGDNTVPWGHLDDPHLHQSQ